MDHQIPASFLRKAVKIAVIGAGGTGSQMVTGLARLHHALLAFGHPDGLDVVLFDDDTVSPINLLRQSFYPCDVGHYKAPTIINRVNMGFALDWKSSVSRITDDSNLGSFDIVIGCVDTRAARKSIMAAGDGSYAPTYWLDCGNRLSDGQVCLGEFLNQKNMYSPNRLPTIADLYPEMVDPLLDQTDEIPSCSLAEALEKQSLFVNSSMTLWACNLLFEFFRYGKISFHGNFINLKSGRTNPLPIDPEVWKRMGYVARTEEAADDAA